MKNTEYRRTGSKLVPGTLSLILALAIAATTCIIPADGATLAAKAKLSTKKLTLNAGDKKSIKIKNKNKKATYTFKSGSKTIASVDKKGVVTAGKAGTAKITVKEIVKKAGKTKKARKLGVVKVTVKERNASNRGGSTGADPNGSNANTNGNPNGTSINPNGDPNGTNPNDPNTGQNPDLSQPTPEATSEPTPEPTPVVYPDSHDAPNGFDSRKNGVEYGTVTKKQYYSSVTGRNRNVNIITPPGYDPDEEEKYPVIYLLQGIGGTEDEWLGGNPNEIVSNLVAAGEAEKMIIVLPNARAGADDSPPANSSSLEHYAKFDNFINDLRDCLMPWMEENYRVATGRENTAISGLSMGARESLYIGMTMPETFGYIGGFSPGYGVFAYTLNGVSEPGMFTDETFTIPDEWKDITYIQIVNGINEGGENTIGGRCSRDLTEHGVNHWFYTTPGGHDFQTWKNGLYNMARCIFKK